MRFDLNGKQVFASTGGREHQPERDWIIFIHGAGGSHLIWSQQVRAFAYDGYNVLAPDLPAHGDSEGSPLESAGAMAEWIIEVMNRLDITTAHLVSHSMGGIVSLEIAANYPDRVKSVSFIATAMSIAVNKAMIETSKTDRPKAYKMMHSGMFSRFGQMHDNSVPGASLLGSGLQIMARNHPDALNADLIACASYKDGELTASKISCPTLCLLSGLDAMVALRFGKKLCEALADNKCHVFEDAGHMLTFEAPREINQQLRQFYSDKF